MQLLCNSEFCVADKDNPEVSYVDVVVVQDVQPKRIRGNRKLHKRVNNHKKEPQITNTSFMRTKIFHDRRDI